MIGTLVTIINDLLCTYIYPIPLKFTDGLFHGALVHDSTLVCLQCTVTKSIPITNHVKYIYISNSINSYK